MQVRHGAYRKALATVTTSVASFSPEETEEHARVLLPRSTAPEIALSSAPEPERATLLEDSDNPASQHDVSPLRGFRYSALTGPGPSDMRPEHAREMLSVRRRPLVGRAWRALSRFQELARLGQLSQSARWVLRTRLVFLENPDSPTPRPIRIGEFLRSSSSNA